jgi:HAD superfamily hydrolase (TIGR01509 family)
MGLDNGRLRAIFFDAGNTLVRMNYAAIADQLAMLGHRVAPDVVGRAEWRARVRLDDELLARPGVSTESGSSRHAYLRLVLEELGLADQATARAMMEWRERYRAPIGIFDVVDPDAEAALVLARQAGLRAAVISNSNGTIEELLNSLDLGRHLDFVIDSFAAGVEKPDPRIFRLALARAELEPSEAVYVGDLYSVDVGGARGAGMEAVLIDPGGYWGARDCPRAEGPLEAVRLIVAGAGDRRGTRGYSGSETSG